MNPILHVESLNVNKIIWIDGGMELDVISLYVSIGEQIGDLFPEWESWYEDNGTGSLDDLNVFLTECHKYGFFVEYECRGVYSWFYGDTVNATVTEAVKWSRRMK